ncbi:MAG: tRNA pseudouridine(38-40) synthase TruA [candidate division WOR-3 bacterium]|nr:tRNA pseudouridine(38-40) synthase TruA [candidate division WOR-3 bacterium]
MQRIKTIIEYDGTEFNGWQVQPYYRTVQGEIENALKKIYKKDIRIEGGGRTDRGVHALGQVASFTVPSRLMTDELKRALNGNIAKDILIKGCEEVSSSFHARFSAKTRIYRYQIYTRESVFCQRYFYQIKEKLQIPLIRESAKHLIGEKDFSNLATKDKGVCDLKKIDISTDVDKIYITVEANHFLRRLVRGIVGLLIDVGRGKIHPNDVGKIISGSSRKFLVAPPQGLFLITINY